LPVFWHTHPAGEIIKRVKTALAQASEEFAAVQTMGGRLHVRWAHAGHATPHGQIVYFAEFLATAGIFDKWVKTCPLHYTSPNASSVRDLLGKYKNDYLVHF
jgi:hypothetical protein